MRYGIVIKTRCSHHEHIAPFIVNDDDVFDSMRSDLK